MQSKAFGPPADKPSVNGEPSPIIDATGGRRVTGYPAEQGIDSDGLTRLWPERAVGAARRTGGD